MLGNQCTFRFSQTIILNLTLKIQKVVQDQIFGRVQLSHTKNLGEKGRHVFGFFVDKKKILVCLILHKADFI